MRKKNREIAIFSLSFLDVFANTIGGLAFLLILAVMMIGAIVFAPPRILTEHLPDAHHGRPYEAWLAAREGLGQFRWTLGEGELPPGLHLDPETGALSGTPELASEDGGEARTFEFEVVCATESEEAAEEPLEDRRRYQLTLNRRQKVETTPLRLATAADLPPAFRGEPYPLTFAAEGGQAPYRWSGRPPAGLTLSPEGHLAGAPATTGSFEFAVSVETPQGERQAGTFTLAVSEQHPPPPPVPPLVVRTEELPPAMAERPYRLQLAAEGGTPPYAWSLAGGDHPWLAVEGTGTLAGTPSLGQVGKSGLAVEVRDAEDRIARGQPLQLEVLPPVPDEPPPLTLRTRTLPEARAGQPYEVAVAGDGGFPPYRWSAEGLDPETGLTFSAGSDAGAGLLSGTPAGAGSVPWTVTLTDRAGRTTSRALTLTVRPAVAPVVIRTAALPEARAGRPYDLALSAVGGHPPYRWRLVAPSADGGSLPPGLALDGERGRLTGEPEQAGDWNLTFTTADAEGREAEEPFTGRLSVLTEQGFRPLRIATRALPVLLAGRASDLTLAAEGGEPPYRWHLAPGAEGAEGAEGGALPSGLRLEEGRITGTATESGDFPLELVVEDASGLVARASLPLAVRWKAPLWLAIALGVLAAAFLALVLMLWIKIWRTKVQPLAILTESLPNARASFDYAVQLACAGGVPPHRWKVVGGDETLPPGLVLEPSGLLHGKPYEGIGLNETKTCSFTVEVEDSWGEKARQEL